MMMHRFGNIAHKRDHQGNVRAVIDHTGALLEANDYYPYGEPMATASTAPGSLQPYKYGGKELLGADSDATAAAALAGVYDFGARWHSSLAATFTQPDPKSESYPSISPYAYCAANPIRFTDPTGEDCVVLVKDSDWIGHLAMLIQNEEGKYQYYSVNGNNVYISGSFQGGRKFNDVGVGSWDSPQEFMESEYNQNHEYSQSDPSVNHFAYKKGYEIPTTAEQDQIMINSFTEQSKTEYQLGGNNCAIIVQNALIDAGIPVADSDTIMIHIPANKYFGEPEYEIEKRNIAIRPEDAYKSIKRNNPNGNEIIIK